MKDIGEFKTRSEKRKSKTLLVCKMKSCFYVQKENYLFMDRLIEHMFEHEGTVKTRVIRVNTYD